MTNARDKANIPVLNFQSKGITVSDTNTAFVYVEENTGSAGDTAGILFKTSSADGFFKTGMILEDDGTTYARGKLHIVQNSTANDSNATVSDAKITILNNGNVGIGTDSPSAKLHVDDSGGGYMKITRTGTSGGIFLETDGTHAAIRSLSSTGSLKFQTNGNNEKMRISSDGKVGIGTSSPDAELHVGDGSGSSDNTRIRVVGGTSGHSTIQLGDSASANIGQIQYDHTNNKLDFRVNSGTRATIDSSGNVGIGESSPIGKFHVKTADTGASAVSGNANELVIENTGNVGMTIQSANDGVGNIYFGDVANGSVGRVSYDHTSNFMSFNTNAGERMRIDSSGRVGLNTTTPGAKIEINSTGSYYNTANQHQQWSYNGTPFLSLYMDAYASPYFDTDSASGWNPGATMVWKRQGSEKMRINSSGDLLIGDSSNTTPAENSTSTHACIPSNGRMSISASGYPCLVTNRVNSEGITIQFRQAGGVRGSISVGGSSTAFNTSSDYRLKENVSYDFDATTKLKQLKPARFNWISDETNTLVDGFIAHEVSDIIPEAIIGTKDAVDENGNIEPQGIDQSKLVPLLVKTIQELEARITTLETTTP